MTDIDPCRWPEIDQPGYPNEKAKKTKPQRLRQETNILCGKVGGPVTNPLSNIDPLQRYLSEISRYNLLTREEEVALGKRVQEARRPGRCLSPGYLKPSSGCENCPGISAGLDAEPAGPDSRGQYRPDAGGQKV
jgi:hypothetical protein